MTTTVSTARHEFVAPRRVARVQAGGYSLAVDAALLEHVHQGPFELTPLPQAPAHVPGAVELRGVAVPVLDIVQLFDESTGAAYDGSVPRASAAGTVGQLDGKMLMVIRHEHGRFAVPVDRVRGLVAARTEQFSEIVVQGEERSGVFSHLFIASETQGLDVLLDCAAVIRIARLHSVIAAPDSGRASQLDLGAMYFVVRAGATHFAFGALQVRQLQSKQPVEPLGFSHRALRGFYRFGRERVAVVDMAVVLGLPSKGVPDTVNDLVVISDERGSSLALSVEKVLDMEPVRANALQSIAADDGTDNTLYRGTYVSDRHGTVIVVDARALWQASTMIDGRALFGHAAAGAGDGASTNEHYIVYRAAGGLLASRVCDARAALQLPADFVDLRQPGQALIGVFTHRNRSVQVMDLGQLMGRDAIDDVVGRPIIVVPTERGLLGLLVEDVVCLREATAQFIPGASRRAYGVIPPFTEMIHVEVQETDRSVTVLGLDALADHADFMQLVSQSMRGEAAESASRVLVASA